MNRDYDDIDPVEYDKSYTVVPREMYLKEYWLPLLEDAIGRYCKDKYVLDLGCGYGIYARMISKYTDNITGIDISKMAGLCRKTMPSGQVPSGRCSQYSLRK